MVESKILEEKVLDNRKVILQKIKETEDNGYEYIRNKIILPRITDDELLARYTRIKPIVSYQELYYYLKLYNVDMMRNQSYIWDLKNSISEQIDMTDAKTIAEFSCYHTYGYYGLFKPSIAEVLQQFPDEILEEANAFYMTSEPKNEHDLKSQSEIINAGCHRSTVKALILKK